MTKNAEHCTKRRLIVDHRPASLLSRYRHVGKHRNGVNHPDGCAWCDSIETTDPCTCRVPCVSGSCTAPGVAHRSRHTIAAVAMACVMVWSLGRAT